MAEYSEQEKKWDAEAEDILKQAGSKDARFRSGFCIGFVTAKRDDGRPTRVSHLVDRSIMVYFEGEVKTLLTEYEKLSPMSAALVQDLVKRLVKIEAHNSQKKY